MTKILPVHLRDDQHQELAQHWVDSGQSMNESVRQGVDMFLRNIKTSHLPKSKSNNRVIKKNKEEL